MIQLQSLDITGGLAMIQFIPVIQISQLIIQCLQFLWTSLSPDLQKIVNCNGGYCDVATVCTMTMSFQPLRISSLIIAINNQYAYT